MKSKKKEVKEKSKKKVVKPAKDIKENKEIDLPGMDEDLVKRLVGVETMRDLKDIGEHKLASGMCSRILGSKSTIYSSRTKFFKVGEPGRDEIIKHIKALKKEGFSKVDTIKMLMKFVSKHL